MKTFAEAFREASQGRTLQWIADQLNQRGFRVHRVTISRYRTGERRPPKDQALIAAMAEVCGVEPADLMRIAWIERDPKEFLKSLQGAGVILVGAGGMNVADESDSPPPTLSSQDEDLEEVLMQRLAGVSGVPLIGLRAAIAAMKAC